MGDLFRFGLPPWQLALRSVLIYAVLLVALRLTGKRQVGQFTLYDLVLILLVANAVQPAMTGPDTSLGGGLVIIAALVATNLLLGWLDSRHRGFNRILEGEPSVIIKDGAYLRPAMAREGLTEEEVETAIREHGLESVESVKIGVLEPDGTISIVPLDASTSTRPAPAAASPAPVDRPCSTRPTSRAARPPAAANTAIATIWTAMAANITGLRPT